jgi:hypothetical protein
VIKERDASVFGLREIRAVITVPTFDTDGKLIVKPGLHTSGLWYEPEIDGIDEYYDPSAETDVNDVLWARELIMDDLLGGFDFKDQASKSNALALTLLPFVREILKDAPTPLHAVIAPQPGAGKTTLVKTCLAPGLGSLDISVEPHDDDELRKKITSVLKNGRRSILFDNLNNELASGTLAAALTTTKWSDRILGESNDVVFDNRLIWTATGNNIGTSSELRDRVCPIWLEPVNGTPARHRPEDSFKHPEIVEWAIEHRAQLAAACIVLVQHWLHGHAIALPDGTFERTMVRRRGKTTMGSFNVWARTMSGILEESDMSGFLENRDQLDVIDLDEHETRVFFQCLFEWSGGDEFDMSKLRPACQFGGVLQERVPSSVGVLRGNNSGDSKILGSWLKSRWNAVHGGLRLRGREGARAWVWRLEKLDE